MKTAERTHIPDEQLQHHNGEKLAADGPETRPLESSGRCQDCVLQGGCSEESHSDMDYLSAQSRLKLNGQTNSDVDVKIQALHSHAEPLAAKFKEGDGRDYIDKAIVLAREALEICPSCSPMRYVCLNRLSLYLSDRYDQLEEIMDIDQAILLDREALALCLPGKFDRSDSLHNLGIRLGTRYDKLGIINDLSDAIRFIKEALTLRSEGHSGRPYSLNRLALLLSTRYKDLGAMDDLDEAIHLNQEALVLLEQGHPYRSYPLERLAADLITRYDNMGNMDDLNEAIRLDQEALPLRPQGNLDRPYSLNNLAADLSIRYDKLGDMEDLKEVIRLDQEALALRPEGHLHRSYSLCRLAGDFNVRYDKLGGMDDLNEAIRLNKEALQAALSPRGTGQPNTDSLNSISILLRSRYDKLGVVDDLNEAIRLDREVLALLPRGHPNRSDSLCRLASDLSVRYGDLGTTGDLDEAIRINQEALTLHPKGHPSCSYPLNCLAILLGSRYDKFGAVDDLNEAIRLDQEALTLRPEGHPHRAFSLNSIALLLSTRYKKLGAMEDLNEAIRLDEEVLVLRPQGHPLLSYSLNSLAADLSIRYSKMGVMDDLNKAIHFNQQALTFCSQGRSQDRAYFLQNLASDLCTRYSAEGTTNDLVDAINLNRESLSVFPSGHPDRSCSLRNLANCLYIQMKDSKQCNHTEEIFTIYTQLTDTPKLVSSDVLSACRAWISVAEEFHHSTTILAYETFLRLLVRHLAILPPLPQHLCLVRDRTSSLAMDAFSACLRSPSLIKAVELLEQGRSVFWGQLTRLRSPVDIVEACGPAGKTLANKFTHLTSIIRNTLRLRGPDQHDHVCRLNFELQSIVDDIRKLPGLSRFLLPSLFSDLRKAATDGPIIVLNASKYDCNALIIFIDQDPIHIPLKVAPNGVRALSSRVLELSVRAKQMEVGREFKGILRDIWDQVVSPIAKVLKNIQPLHSRIWWCPTADFCLLPLHAAAPFRKGQAGLPDLYISSYTPSFTSLIRARRQTPSSSTGERKRFVAMGQANAIGESKLVSVESELTSVRQRIGDFTTFTLIEGEDSCIARVTEELNTNEWVHFACHGLPNRERPFESAFALHDGRFTVEDIMRCELENAEFAYLSACHTTVGDSQSPDEMIHLASAMHFAGFRSVIGTMWAVDDKQANKVASMFYENMIGESGRLDYTRAAYALHKATNNVKDVTLDQRIVYVHIGA